MRRIILRTAEEKADLVGSWARPDEDFFASGACHVLAAAFLRRHPAAGFRAWGIWPRDGGRGMHVVAAREDLVFDWVGYTPRARFLEEYFAAYRARFPGWSADVEVVEADALSWDFCRATRSRHPSQFLHDPLPRALAYVDRFATPVPVEGGLS